MLTLRPYQREAIDAVYDHWQEGGGDALVVLPTGSGKTPVLAQLVKELMHNYPLMRICLITHVKELIAQGFEELIRMWPQAPAGIYSAGIGRKDTNHPILFCGIQSVWNKADKIGKFDLCIIDEVQLVSRKTSSMYGQFFQALRIAYPDMRLLGLTATPYRMDSGRLDQGDDAMFEKIVYEANVYDLIEQGYLSPLISKSTKAEISVTGVHKRGGEYIAGELEKAAMADDLVKRAAEEIVARGEGRKAWLCFCSGVDHAVAVRDALRDLGVNAEEINGATPKKERDRLISMFKHGHIKCLTSVNVLSIGFNVPHVDLVALLRPTESAGLYIQQVGRGFRKAKGKENALILDFAGNVRKHGPVNMVEAKDKKPTGEGEKSAPCKCCPHCESYMPISLKECLDCGYVWPERDPVKHAARPENVDILVKQAPNLTGWQQIEDVEYGVHRKFGKPPTLRVTYLFQRKQASEWIGFSHPEGSYPRKRAITFWLSAGGMQPIPASAQEAWDRIGELGSPERMYVQMEGKYFVPKRVTYGPKKEAA